MLKDKEKLLDVESLNSNLNNVSHMNKIISHDGSMPNLNQDNSSLNNHSNNGINLSTNNKNNNSKLKSSGKLESSTNIINSTSDNLLSINIPELKNQFENILEKWYFYYYYYFEQPMSDTHGEHYRFITLGRCTFTT